MTAPKTSPIILDVSRLLDRAARRVPTGIDRVEHAYAAGLHRLAGHRLHYAAVHPIGRFSHLPTAPTRAFVERLGARWQHAADKEPADAKPLARRLQAGMMLPRPRPRFLHGATSRPTYLLVSHHHLHQPELIEAARQRFGAAFVCFIHDHHPMDFPEFNHPDEPAKHRRRLDTAIRYADALVFSSAQIRDATRPYIARAGRDIPLLVAPFGVDPPPAAAPEPPASDARPYFLCISTIEPRKNHLLLLNVWRRLALEMGEHTPRLVLVGQRGWENEMIIDILERSELLRDCIVEHNSLPDATVRALVAGARAVLMPSFGEGFGLPIAEALAAGTPVLCSDLPAHREVGAAAAEYLDTLDGLGWAAAIRDYTPQHSPRRAQALARLANWAPPGWPEHVQAVLDVIDAL